MIILRVLMGRAWDQDAASVTGTVPLSLSSPTSNSDPNTARFSAITVSSPNRARFTYSSDVTAVALKTFSSKVSLYGSREFKDVDSKTLSESDIPPSPSTWITDTTIGAAL